MLYGVFKTLLYAGVCNSTYINCIEGEVNFLLRILLFVFFKFAISVPALWHFHKHGRLARAGDSWRNEIALSLLVKTTLIKCLSFASSMMRAPDWLMAAYHCMRWPIIFISKSHFSRLASRFELRARVRQKWFTFGSIGKRKTYLLPQQWGVV